ncbi:hypothetical protein R9P_43060 [Escherichia coli]|nr:hypothetical protein R9P_43060 [Escherichia coli]
MQLNSTEISELIKQRIAQFNVVSEAHGALYSILSVVFHLRTFAC